MEKHRIDYVAHDAEPYNSAGQDDVYEQIKLMGKFLPTQRTPSISTSELITRIVKDYNDFVRRNLERGVTPKELNLSLLREGEIWMEKNIDKFLQELKKTSFQVKGFFFDPLIILGNWKSSTEELLEVIKKNREK